MTANKDKEMYHYTECGLDDVYLQNGFKITKSRSGRSVSIKNIEGLHDAIGENLVLHKKDLNGKEIRFLRHELLMSQSTLAHCLGIGWQAINRWENGKTQIPKPAEALIRLLYMSTRHPEKGGDVKKCLKKIADLEDEISGLKMKTTAKGWEQVKLAA